MKFKMTALEIIDQVIEHNKKWREYYRHQFDEFDCCDSMHELAHTDSVLAELHAVRRALLGKRDTRELPPSVSPNEKPREP